MQLLSILCVTFCLGEDNDATSLVTLSQGISEVFENGQKSFQVTLCHLETLALERIRVDEIMQQEIRPLVAVDIIEQLHRQFAILSGGRGKDGAPIITFPEFAGFSDIPDEDFLNVVTYLTSIPSLEAASIGFIIIIDRRRDKWSAVKASLTRIAVSAFFCYLSSRN
uniref:MCF.2 cell line derived transforming sequence-like 2 n=1 Tax=Buteo japonicus TaxID=224669 RepID=A0A8C0BDQ9_9AVES